MLVVRALMAPFLMSFMSLTVRCISKLMLNEKVGGILKLLCTTVIRNLKQQRLQRQRKPDLKINIWWRFCDYCLFLASFIVDWAGCKWTGRSAVGVNTENERATVVCSRCRLNLKVGNLTLSFGRLRQRIVLNACCTCSTIIFPHSTNYIMVFCRRPC